MKHLLCRKLYKMFNKLMIKNAQLFHYVWGRLLGGVYFRVGLFSSELKYRKIWYWYHFIWILVSIYGAPKSESLRSWIWVSLLFHSFVKVFSKLCCKVNLPLRFESRKSKFGWTAHSKRTRNFFLKSNDVERYHEKFRYETKTNLLKSVL